MPSKSEVISFNGVAIPSGVTGNVLSESARPRTDPTYQDRQDAPAAFQSAMRPPVEYEAIFKMTTYAQQAAAVAWLDFPRNKKERTLVIYGGDFDSPISVQTGATVKDIEVNAGEVKATFLVGNSVWESSSATTQGPTSFAASGNTTFSVAGECTTNPLVKVGWSVQRPSATATVGWKYRRTVVVTNNDSQSLHNYPLQLGPWDTAALITASKMRSDQFDVAIFNDKGERVKTECVAKNSKACFVWFVIEELAAGASRTYDLCYGNTASNDANGFPYYRPYSPAIDITGTDGTVSSYSSPTVTTAKTADANEFVGAAFLITGGAQIGTYRTVATNTTGANSQITFTRLPSGTIDNTSTYVIVRSGFTADGGTSTGVTSTSITDSSQVWGINQWIGATVETYNAGSGVTVRTGTVTANTATALTITAWDGATPSSGDRYRVYRRNGKWIWFVHQGARAGEREMGRWRLNLGSARPSNMYFPVDGVPGSWGLTTYNPGQASNDFNQLRYTQNGTDFFSVLNASMARKDGAKLVDEGFANGCEINIPLGLLGIKHDFQIKNPDGMCRAVFGCREQGGADWNLYKEYSTTQATLTTIATAYYDLTVFGTPLHAMAAITSDDDADVADDQTGTANLQDGSVLEAFIDTRSLSVTDIATATEDTVYDMSLTVRRGAAGEAAGDDLIRIGGTDRHVFLLSTQKLWIGDDGIVPFGARIYLGSAFVRDVPNTVRVYNDDVNQYGVVTRYYSSDVLPLAPGSMTLRVSDEDGNIGTVDITTIYSSNYL